MDVIHKFVKISILEVNLSVCTLGEKVSIKSSMVTTSKVKTIEHARKFTPSVIESSFGIGRIIYCLFEHSFYTKPDKAGDEELNVFRFNPLWRLLSAQFSLWFVTKSLRILLRTSPSL